MTKKEKVLYDSAKFCLAVSFDPRDLWIGLYWDKQSSFVNIYLCILPMLPINLTFEVKGEEDE